MAGVGATRLGALSAFWRSVSPMQLATTLPCLLISMPSDSQSPCRGRMRGQCLGGYRCSQVPLHPGYRQQLSPRPQLPTHFEPDAVVFWASLFLYIAAGDELQAKNVADQAAMASPPRRAAVLHWQGGRERVR